VRASLLEADKVLKIRGRTKHTCSQSAVGGGSTHDGGGERERQ